MSGATGVDLPDDDPDALEWPKPRAATAPGDVSARYAAQLDVRKKRVDAEIARTKARTDADLEDMKAFSDAYRDLASTGIQRARDGADAVLKGSAAIVALYTGVLGLVFAADGTPLPARGVVAPLFLGAAIVLAIAYLAFLKPRDESAAGHGGATDDVSANITGRARTFMEVTKLVTRRLSWCLRAAVVCLGVGVAFLPLPFVDASELPFTSSTTTSTGANASSQTAPSWPAPTVGSGENLELKKILYEAQVKYASDTATLENEATPPGGRSDTEFIVWAVGIGALMVVAITLLSGARRRSN